jgi:MoaA/NifB/PqqE/SkfB family radical SAM enzyme
MNLRHAAIRLRRLFSAVRQSWSGYPSPPGPYLLVIEVTRRCNAHCSYCDSWKTPGSEKDTELSGAEYRALLDDAYELGARMVSFSGGEPLLRPDFIAIARHARRLGFRTALNTNGYLISAESARELTAVLDSVTVSIDSWRTEAMAARRGSPAALERAMEGLRHLVDARRRAGQVRVNAVVDEGNAGDLDELAAELRKLRVPLLLQPLHRQGIFEDNRGGPPAGVQGSRVDFVSFAGRKAGLSWPEGRYLEPFYAGFEEHLAGRPRWFRCFAGSFAFHVTPQGDVIVCQTQRRSMGNLRERPLREIWRSMAEARRHISSNERGCSCWLLCSTVNYLQADRLDRACSRLRLPGARTR